jgi:tripartite-type tricarboxylate transporter receptor subunit TctC
MKLPRRKFMCLAASAATLTTAPHFARAKTYPTRPLHIVAGAPPGGAADILARLG